MKYATLFAFALLFTACHEEPTMTFGLDFRLLRSDLPEEDAGGWCVPPGNYGGQISAVSLEFDGPPPHLFIDADPDAEEDVYRVRVYVASEREKGGVFWEPSEILAERTYDAKFGASSGADSLSVEFEGRGYTVEAQGLPADATCP